MADLEVLESSPDRLVIGHRDPRTNGWLSFVVFLLFFGAFAVVGAFIVFKDGDTMGRVIGGVFALFGAVLVGALVRSLFEPILEFQFDRLTRRLTVIERRMLRRSVQTRAYPFPDLERVSVTEEMRSGGEDSDYTVFAVAVQLRGATTLPLLESTSRSSALVLATSIGNMAGIEVAESGAIVKNPADKVYYARGTTVVTSECVRFDEGSYAVPQIRSVRTSATRLTRNKANVFGIAFPALVGIGLIYLIVQVLDPSTNIEPHPSQWFEFAFCILMLGVGALFLIQAVKSAIKFLRAGPFTETYGVVLTTTSGAAEAQWGFASDREAAEIAKAIKRAMAEHDASVANTRV